MKDLPSRRSILMALGGIAAYTAGGVARADGSDDETHDETHSHPTEPTDPAHHDQPDKRESRPTRSSSGIATLPCGDTPWASDGEAGGLIELCNCSPCTRTVTIGVSGELLAPNGDEIHGTGTRTVHIPSGETVMYQYTGSLDRLDMSEPADMNVAISQRSLPEANGSHCQRSCKRC